MSNELNYNIIISFNSCWNKDLMKKLLIALLILPIKGLNYAAIPVNKMFKFIYPATQLAKKSNNRHINLPITRIIPVFTAGFTLAELLIALLIIGVVASLTIPAIVQDTQEAELHTAWKKIYAEYSQALINIHKDLGVNNVLALCTSGDDQCARDLFGNYLSYQKKCDHGSDAYGQCFIGPSSAVQIKCFDGTPKTIAWVGDAGAVLSDGSSVVYWSWGEYNSRAVIIADVNGFKGPNTIGKDIYALHLINNANGYTVIRPFDTAGLYPEGGCNMPSGCGFIQSSIVLQ